MGGGRSSSTSSSSNSNLTDNSNTQINETEGIVLNFEGSDNNDTTLIQTDHDAVKESFNFGESALDKIDKVVENSLNTVDDTANRAFDFGEDALDDALGITNKAIDVAGNAQSNAFKKIKDIAEAFGSSSSTTNLMLAVVGIGVLGVIGFLVFGRRR